MMKDLKVGNSIRREKAGDNYYNFTFMCGYKQNSQKKA